MADIYKIGAHFGRYFKSSLIVLFLFAVNAHADPASHGIAMHGSPALNDGFENLPYANPNAPKGGRIVYAARGSFDSVNPFILKGQKVRGLRDSFLGNNVYESLLFRSRDEPFTLYGLLAESITIPDDRSSIEFHLNPKAKFSDGEQVKPEDVIFTAELLAEKGRPNFKRYYSNAKVIEKTGPHSVKFTFNDGKDRELPLLLALMPILPKHAIDPDTFDQTTLVPIIGTGPYLLTNVEQGEHILLTKNPDYWGKDLPVKKGRDNFDEIRIDYYRDTNALFEAFKKGLVDVYFESDPNNWSDGYGGRGLEEGRIVQSSFESKSARTTSGYAFNTRREPFNNINIRKALTLLFDFEWVNANLFNNGYARTAGFFFGSDLSAYGVPISESELELLKPFMDEIDPSVLDGTFELPKTDGSGRDRQVLREALTIFRDAGYKLDSGKLLDANGNQLSIELLVPGAASANRVANAYRQNLRNLGIDLVIRGVDAAQFEERRKSFDFDMIIWSWSGSLSPGNEQYFRWGGTAADQPGSFNFSGVESKGVDAMIDAMLAARDREQFRNAVRALDRLLMSGFYVLPHYHLPKQLIAHSSRIGIPKRTSLYGVQPTTWWIKDTAQ